jgi:hypothetical protein
MIIKSGHVQSKGGACCLATFQLLFFHELDRSCLRQARMNNETLWRNGWLITKSPQRVRMAPALEADSKIRTGSG